MRPVEGSLKQLREPRAGLVQVLVGALQGPGAEGALLVVLRDARHELPEEVDLGDHPCVVRGSIVGIQGNQPHHHVAGRG